VWEANVFMRWGLVGIITLVKIAGVFMNLLPEKLMIRKNNEM